MSTMTLLNLFSRTDKKTETAMNVVRVAAVANDRAALRLEAVFKRVIDAKQGISVHDGNEISNK